MLRLLVLLHGCAVVMAARGKQNTRKKPDTPKKVEQKTKAVMKKMEKLSLTKEKAVKKKNNGSKAKKNKQEQGPVSPEEVAEWVPTIGKVNNYQVHFSKTNSKPKIVWTCTFILCN